MAPLRPTTSSVSPRKAITQVIRWNARGRWRLETSTTTAAAAPVAIWLHTVDVDLVDQNSASWNPLISGLRRIQELQSAPSSSPLGEPAP